MLEATSICHLVKPADLNHHETLYAGRMAEWLIEACFICATRLIGRTDGVICVRVHEITFRRPIRAGAVVRIGARVARLGESSITVHAGAEIDLDSDPRAGAEATGSTVASAPRGGAGVPEGPTALAASAGAQPAVTSLVTFVAIDREGRSREHGLTLPAEYIAEHRDLYEQAGRASRS